MLAQKQLLTVMAPETILLMTYAVGAVLLLPAARPSLVVALPPWAFLLLSAVALMTLASYLSFGAAMNHLEASRIGAVIAVSPLLTVAAARLVSAAVPGAVAFERLNALALIGAVMVVAGSFVTTLARRR
jgi:drug/metabolite transporter (DMT)-like permease